MTDRELLELAAKAYFAKEVADEVCSFQWDEKANAIVYIHGENQDHNGNDVALLWIPMDDDGDALRLQVKLSLHVRVMRKAIMVEKRELGDDTFEPIGNDPYAATRRAIVRAAASIGGER